MRIATDVACQKPGLPVAPMLHPFFADLTSAEQGTSWEKRYLDFWRDAASLFEVVDVPDADVVLIPADWYWVRGTSWASKQDRELAGRCLELYRCAVAAGKPVVVFFTGDRSCDRVPMPEAIVLREGPFKSRMSANDRVLPAFAEDLVAHFCDGQIVERVKRELPVVGFCGLAGRKTGLKNAAKRVAFAGKIALTEHRIDPSQFLGENMRAEALELLAADARVSTNFVIRSQSVFFVVGDAKDLVDVRQQYVDNMIDCDYVLCMRGSGNYSYRFYEALCMGRIPVFVDTDCKLPFDDVIDWRSLCVWVDQRDLGDIASAVAEFHARLTPDEFIALQHRARSVWVDYLSARGYLGRFAEVLAKG